MDVTAEDFRRHYESLSDEALLEVDTDELVQLARTCHAEEVARRGLDTGPAADEETADASYEGPDSGEEAEGLVCIVEYDYLDEADLARGLLEAAEIPTSLENGPGVFRLLVPRTLADQALGMLVTELSDEDLAAQAEAAGNPDEDTVPADDDSERAPDL